MTPAEEDPIRGITAQLILADYAQAADGKLNLIGAGWTAIGPQPTPFAVAVMMELPWHEASVEHELRLDLIDMDGAPVRVPTPTGMQPVKLGAKFSFPVPDDHPHGFPVAGNVGINNGPIPFMPDSYFEWRLEIDGKTNADWRRAFRTRPMVQSDSASDDAEAA